MSTTLAGPMTAQCCARPGTQLQHEGEPRGREEHYAGVRTYVARPTDSKPEGEAKSKGVILYFSDIFGPFYTPARLTMDYWAEHGFTVLAVDYLEGDSIDKHLGTPGFEWQSWVAPIKERAPVIAKTWMAEVKKVYGGEKLFCIGNCFGAPFVLEAVAEDWITAGSFAHPAFLEEEHFKKVKKPLLMLCAEEDHSFGHAARRRAVDILIEAKVDYTVVLYSGIEHGFATRADTTVPKQRWGKEHAAQTALGWFDHHSSA